MRPARTILTMRVTQMGLKSLTVIKRQISNIKRRKNPTVTCSTSGRDFRIGDFILAVIATEGAAALLGEGAGGAGAGGGARPPGEAIPIRPPSPPVPRPAPPVPLPKTA
jgi:hypothetical protein